MGVVIGHYYCELADEQHGKGQLSAEQNSLKKALQFHPACVRALLSRAQATVESGSYRLAIGLYHKIIRLSPDFIPLTLPPLQQCYLALSEGAQWLQFLRECMQQTPQVSVAVAIAQHLQQHAGAAPALDFMLEQVTQHPSLLGLKAMLSCYLADSVGAPDQRLRVIDALLTELLALQPNYQCLHCGFTSKSLFWLCPSCHHWETLKPAYPREVV